MRHDLVSKEILRKVRNRTWVNAPPASWPSLSAPEMQPLLLASVAQAQVGGQSKGTGGG